MAVANIWSFIVSCCGLETMFWYGIRTDRLAVAEPPLPWTVTSTSFVVVLGLTDFNTIEVSLLEYVVEVPFIRAAGVRHQ
jgi:hypothetical protein